MNLPPLGRALAAPRRLGLAGLALAATLLLTGCTQVAIIKSAPLAGSFDAAFGNDPLAAADASTLEANLKSVNQAWGIRFATQPAEAGYAKVTDSNEVLAGRGKVSVLDITLTATAPATLQGFSAGGPQIEQQYLETLAQRISQAGYNHLTAVRIDVYFLTSHHSVLTWSVQHPTDFSYKVLDGKP